MATFNEISALIKTKAHQSRFVELKTSLYGDEDKPFEEFFKALPDPDSVTTDNVKELEPFASALNTITLSKLATIFKEISKSVLSTGAVRKKCKPFAQPMAAMCDVYSKRLTQAYQASLAKKKSKDTKQKAVIQHESDEESCTESSEQATDRTVPAGNDDNFAWKIQTYIKNHFKQVDHDQLLVDIMFLCSQQIMSDHGTP